MKMNTINKLLIYKILETVVLLTLLAWGAALLAENILPGFISGHLSFLKLIIFASILIIAFSVLGKNIGLSFNLDLKKWHLSLLVILSIILISLSLIKFHLAEVTIITITTLVIMFYFFKVLFEE